MVTMMAQFLISMPVIHLMMINLVQQRLQAQLKGWAVSASAPAVAAPSVRASAAAPIGASRGASAAARRAAR
ncbi:MAG: hypothetical protein F6K11_22370, partial [Leptolyngbya sp. SIO3F4]|nr:hypothetical protein [Leptolyngbya sp. SIO3F4]